MGHAAAAYPDQDHIAHIKIHLAYANDPAYGGNPVIGPAFSPHALEHIKQHLTLHYLQSMRAYVAQAAGGKDTLDLHQEKPLTLEAQQALALASQMVSEDSQQNMAQYVQQIQALAQKVQQAQQAQQQNAALSDPTASVILQTQKAETERKAAEAQAKMQLEMQKDKQDYDFRVADLQRMVAELKAKYETQTALDANRSATQIAMADINNASRERIANLQANVGLTSDQMALAHEQNMTAMAASTQAQSDIRQHGISVEQQAFQHQADQTKAQIKAQQDAQLADQQHQQALMQQQAAQQQQMAAPQPAVAPQQPQPPTGAQ
jgi:hypothetical protein